MTVAIAPGLVILLSKIKRHYGNIDRQVGQAVSSPAAGRRVAGAGSSHPHQRLEPGSGTSGAFRFDVVRRHHGRSRLQRARRRGSFEETVGRERGETDHHH